ncbi:MAG: O-antigen ligase family protein [Planctomycetota bacterium]|nr:O-antigen ligase family protein [Planctomycetota bacterium]
MSEFIRGQFVCKWSITFAIFVFPIVATSLKHGATSVYFFLAALVITFGWPARKALPNRLRTFVFALFVYFAIVVLTLVRSDDFHHGLSKLERYLRLPLFVPALLLFLHVRTVNIGAVYLSGSLVGAVVSFLYAISQTLVPVFLFSVSSIHSDSLAMGQMSEGLRQEFIQHDHTLAEDPTVLATPDGWILRDINHRQVRIRQKDGVLEISGTKYLRAMGAYHPIILGDFCVYLAGIIAAWLIVVARLWWQHVFGIVCVGLSLYTCLLSGTRGAWLCLPVMGLFVLLLYRKRLGAKGWACLLLVPLVASTLSPALLPQGILHRLSEFREGLFSPSQDASADERLEMWKASLIIASESPLFGSGLGDFRLDLGRLIEKGKCQASVHDHAHSIYFDALARTGIIGTLAMLVVVFAMPFRLFVFAWFNGVDPNARFCALSGLRTVLSFSVFGLTEAWFSRMPLVTVYLVSIMVFLAGTTACSERNLISVVTTPNDGVYGGAPSNRIAGAASGISVETLESPGKGMGEERSNQPGPM